MSEKAIIFEVMMQQVIFHSYHLHRGIQSLKKRVLFSKFCIVRFLKAIVFSDKQVTNFIQVIENQHFVSQSVGFLFLHPVSSKNSILRQ